MSDLTFLITAAAAAFALSHWLKLPVIPLLILLGFGASLLGVGGDLDALKDLMGLGLAFLVYAAGIELNPARFRGKLAAVAWIAAAQFLALSAAGFLLGWALGFDRVSALYLAAALATSSTFVVLRQLHRRIGSLRSYGGIAIGVLLLQDLAIIVLIVILGTLPEGAGGMMRGLVALVGLALLAVVGQRWVFPWIVRRTRWEDEISLLVLLAVLFLFAGLAHWLGLPFVVGAFFAGFSLSSFPVDGVARSLLRSLNSFFLALFFTALGALVAFPDPVLTLKALALALLVMMVTPPLVTALAEWKGGLSSRYAITCGLLLAQTSEFSFVLALYALHLDQVSPEVMSVIAIVAVVTMTMTPLLATDGVARRLLALHPVHRRLSTETEHRNHILMLGFGTEGMWVARPLRQAGHEVVVVDHDPVIVEQLKRARIPCIRGDVTDPKVLIRAGISQTKVVLISTPNVDDALSVLCSQELGEIPVLVRTFEEHHARKIEDHGGVPILNSKSAADSFMEWFAEFDR